MKRLIPLFIACLAVSACSNGKELIGVYAYEPNPGAVVTAPDSSATGAEFYQIDMPNVGEGYYQHLINKSIDSDGADYTYGDRVTFTWAANILDGKQEIAAFTDGEGNSKRIIYDPDVKNALVDESGNVYKYIKN